MEYNKIDNSELGAHCRWSVFQPKDGLAEVHSMITIEARGEDFSQQRSRLLRAVAEFQQTESFRSLQPVFRRFFLSDAVNQLTVCDDDPCLCATSYIGQPPLNCSKIALWVYYVGAEAEVQYNADSMGSTIVRYKGIEHIWTMNMQIPVGSSYEQTQRLLKNYESLLHSQYHISMESNCLRTWFFVKDVDTQYKGLVVARREFFQEIGMTTQTHYIASTGIGGTPCESSSLVQLGCYALRPSAHSGQTAKERTRYLYAPTHLNRTYEYGVTFERGAVVTLSERHTAYISGTASINNRGEVLHVGDVRAQTLRMWKNVEALLQEGGMSMENVLQMVVYLRDIADYQTVSQMFDKRFPDVPRVITLAPVCRPAWLVEMEVIAACV